MFDRELKRGTTPMLILALLEVETRHGYELSKLIESQSKGALRIHAATLYPLLYRLEKDGMIAGHWVEKAGQRSRRYYKLTAAGRRALASQRKSWLEFTHAIALVAGVDHA
jgi:PadR family transcriptional regulator PadR